MKALRKIVWTVDPFEKDPEIREHGIDLLKDLARKSGAEVYPVFVLSDGLLSLSLSESALAKHFKKLAESEMKKYLEFASMPQAKPAHIAISAPSSRSDCARIIDRYAKKIKADAIFIQSHGRSGLGRALLGSFAETLVLHAKTPIILSGPKNVAEASLKNVLFATDLSPRSKGTFRKVLELAVKSQSKLTILHAIPRQLEAVVQAQAALFGGAWTPMIENPEGLSKKEQALLESFRVQAKKFGVNVEVVVDQDCDSVSSSILRTAKDKNANLIAMASESEAFAAAILGSIGRVVSREAPCAVWFFRSHDK